MHSPYFSIIIPIYKARREFLDVCLQSILAQTMDDFEVILVDDGCPDGSGVFCDEYAAQCEKIRVLHQANQGVSEARNHGIDVARGKWILFIDEDDWVENNACATIKRYTEGAEFDILHFAAVRELHDKSIVMDYGLRHHVAYNLHNAEDKEYIYRRAMQAPDASGSYYHTMYYSWDKAYGREFLEANKLRFPKGIRRSEDKLFILECLQRTSTYLCVPEALYHYRMNEESVCHRFSNNVDEDRIEMFKRLEPLACEMDHELSVLKNEPTYHKLHDEYKRLVFSMIPDILRLKYYHKEYRPKCGRKADVVCFLNTEPFATAIKETADFNLNLKNKIKLYLLEHKCIYTHMLLCKALDAGRKSL